MTEKICPECNGKVLLIKAPRTKGAAPRAMDRALSPMMGKTPKKYGIRTPSGLANARRLGHRP
jgi:hypothetical protein